VYRISLELPNIEKPFFVLTVETLGGTMHMGPRSAGNKSLLSYRAGHGITGYGGYCPSSESIPVPIKEGPSAMAHGVTLSHTN